jgi:hypothetical protein
MQPPNTSIGTTNAVDYLLHHVPFSVELNQGSEFNPVIFDPWSAKDAVEFRVRLRRQNVERGTIKVRGLGRLGGVASEMPLQSNSTFEIGESPNGSYSAVVWFFAQIKFRVSSM